MKITRSYKTKLVVNSSQREMLAECARVSRDAYNWGLAHYIEEYKKWYARREEAGDNAGYPPHMNARARKTIFNNTVRKTDGRYITPSYIPRTITQEAFEALEKAHKRFESLKKSGEVGRKMNEQMSGKKQEKFKRRYARKRERGYVGDMLKPMFPKFKSRFDRRIRFRFRCDTVRADGTVGFRVERDRIELGTLGWFRLAETGYLPTDNWIRAVSISSDNGIDWYISVSCEEDAIEQKTNPDATVGVDVGINPLIQCSNGLRFDNPKALRKYEKQRSRIQRELSRRRRLDADGRPLDRQSAGYYETLDKLNRIDAKIKNVRANSTHTATKRIVSGCEATIKIEDLNVAGMLKNKRIAKSVADSNMSEIHRQLKYKGEWRGKKVIEIDRFAASSKTCNNCGHKNNDLKLGVKLWECPKCGTIHDRDLNAANNIRDM